MGIRLTYPKIQKISYGLLKVKLRKTKLIFIKIGSLVFNSTLNSVKINYKKLSLCTDMIFNVVLIHNCKMSFYGNSTMSKEQKHFYLDYSIILKRNCM